MRKIMQIGLAFALMVSTAGIVAAQPSTEPVDPRDDCTWFDETGHNLCGVFETYWNDHGGLPIFGIPITEAQPEENLDTGEIYETQYFERERMEHHPDLAETPYEVLLGRIGNEVLLETGRNWFEFPSADPDDEHYMEATGHAIAPEFYDYWSSHGLGFGDKGVSFRESLALFGYPISPAQVESNPDGDTVLTQWFERARFEYHPDNDEEHQVLLGRLGAELLELRTQPSVADMEVIADGLNSPRGMYATDDGVLYVAEAGVGGDDCYTGPMEEYSGAEFCAGSSGEVSRIVDGERTTVLSELPSIATGGDAFGPHDVVLTEDGEIVVPVGSLGSPEELGEFGHLVKGNADDGWSTIADVSTFQYDRDPESEVIASNVYSVVIDSNGDYVVADSAMNKLLNVTGEGDISILAELGNRMVELPPAFQEPEGPEEIPMDTVPTGLTIGPDGAYYVGELTGFPFPVGDAHIWRVTADGETEAYADGFTNVIDVAFDSEGRLYVLELVSGGLLNVDPEDPATLESALIRVEDDGSRTVIASEGLAFATGLEIAPDDTIYVANMGVPGAGEIVRIELAD